MKKNILFVILTFIIIILILSSLVVYATNRKEENTLQQKVSQELIYLNQYLISLLGDFNNLTIGDNRIQQNEPKIQSNIDTDFGQKTEDSKKEDQKGKSKGENKEESKEDKNSGSLQENENNNNDDNKTDTSQNTILSNNGKYTPDWDKIEIQIEQLYQIWNTIAIDLHSLNINSNAILSFSDGLNNATRNVKNKDKESAVDNINKIYQLLLEYRKGYEENSKKINILTIQTDVVSAYANVTNEQWNKAEEKIMEAERIFASELNTITNDYDNQIVMNQSYILVNELRKAIKLKDKEIFYIEYKNLMSKMEILVG